MIDTHAHIDFKAFDDDRDEIIKSAFNEGLEYIIIPGVEPKDYNKLLELSSKYNNIFCAMGVHPHNSNDYNKDVRGKIIDNTENPNVKAIGEIGLDYYYDFATPDVQKNAFREQLKIAKDCHLPVIIHNREADEDIYKILKQEQNGNLKAVLHCFSSGIEFMQKVIDLGCYISFTGNITFKKSDLIEVVNKTPMDNIMIETDSPFLAPVPFRGKRNEPKFVKYIAKKIAEIKSIPIDEVISMTSKTAKKFFNLLLLSTIFICSYNFLMAQRIIETDDESGNIEQDSLIHPYHKFIGIGPMVGSNTVVETYFVPNPQTNKKQDIDISYEGIFSYGFGINYGLFDFLVLGLSYNYSQNKKIAEEQKFLIDPTIYQNIEFATRWIINPYSRVNFYGVVGFSYLFNSFSRRPVPEKPAFYVDNNQLGLLTGVGMFINIPTDLGLFNICAEWSLNFETETKSLIYKDKETDARSFYSIPRVYIFYYPPF